LRTLGSAFKQLAMRRRLLVLASFVSSTLALSACDPRNPPMPEQWAEPTIAPYSPSSSLPEATHEGTGPEGSLLASYAKKDRRAVEDHRTWQLPFQAKTLIVELLIAAGQDDAEHVQLLLADNARWGLPDRRELRARPIISEDDPHGAAFLAGFRTATSRFDKGASFSCAPLQPGWQMYATTGAEPMWCSYTSQDNLDIIGFRLIVVEGRVKADYIGFFPERLEQPMRVTDAGDPPPLTPYPKRPVDLSMPELMPDGSNPVLARPKR
jgi:hypothetical protein